MYGQYKPYIDRDPIQCPVCKSLLGSRLIEELFIEHCNECKATFTWHPNENKPTVEMDSKKSKSCGCESCKERDRNKK